MKKYFCVFFSIFLLLVTSASAFQTSASEGLDFSGWDHSAVVNGGQHFAGICGDVDVTVTASGDFTADSQFTATLDGVASSLQTQLDPVGSQTYTFEFSEPVSLVVDLDLLDSFETLEVTTDGSASYSHGSGSMPAITTMANGIMLQGTAVGNGADGAAIGNVPLQNTRTLTLRYSALPSAFTKFGAFSLGKVVSVPEPAAAGMLLLGLTALTGLRRRR